MSFRVEQKVGNHIYVYEVTSYWDKDKKQPRQRRILIGKKDPATGEIVPRTTRRLSREYGAVYLLWHILQQLGIPALVEAAFAADARPIILTACFQVAEQRPLYLCGSWLERIYLKEPLTMSSSTLSRLLKDIGDNQRAIAQFMEAWSTRQKHRQFIVFDITSISSYSTGIGYVEWGYNRDREQLAQVNLGVVYGEPEGLPLVYSLYPGSVADVKTLKNILTTLSAFKVPLTVFVLDKGFYSRANLAALGEEMKFVIPVPMTNKEVSALLKRRRSELSSPEHAFRSGKQLLSCIEDTVHIDGRSYRALWYLNERTSLEERERLLGFLLEIEQQVRSHQSQSVATLSEQLDERYPDWRRHLTLQDRRGELVVTRLAAAVEQHLDRAGTMVLITNTDLSAERALEFYRKKDGVEKLFDSMKHGIDRRRLRIHSRTTLQGLLFIDFISLILYSSLQRTLHTTGLGKRYTVNELFAELKKLSVIEIGTRTTMVTELTRKLQQIFKAFKIPVPIQS